MRRTALPALLLALALGQAQAADTPFEFKDAATERRYQKLAAELRCLVCQNQSVAESKAGIAVDLRNQVREQVAAGKSDREIIDFMTNRYGDFVLYKPPVKATTVLLWFGPLLLLVVGGLAAWRILRARRTLPVMPDLTEAERARAAALLGGEGSAK